MSNQDKRKKQKNHSNNDDLDLFRQFCKNVKPLKEYNKTLESRPSHKTIKTSNSTILNKPQNHYSIDTIKKVDAETLLHYSQPHLHRNLFRQMKRGTLSIEAILDLHHCTVDEAFHRMSHFLDTSCQEGFRWVLIIHGKGRLSKHGLPILKSFLNEWLKKESCVLAFHSAQPKHGGSGAVYVLLKSKKGVQCKTTS